MFSCFHLSGLFSFISSRHSLHFLVGLLLSSLNFDFTLCLLHRIHNILLLIKLITSFSLHILHILYVFSFNTNLSNSNFLQHLLHKNFNPCLILLNVLSSLYLITYPFVVFDLLFNTFDTPDLVSSSIFSTISLIESYCIHLSSDSFSFFAKIDLLIVSLILSL